MLLKAGFAHIRSKGRHRIYVKEDRRIVVPFHGAKMLPLKIAEEIAAASPTVVNERIDKRKSQGESAARSKRTRSLAQLLGVFGGRCELLEALAIIEEGGPAEVRLVWQTAPAFRCAQSGSACKPTSYMEPLDLSLFGFGISSACSKLEPTLLTFGLLFVISCSGGDGVAVRKPHVGRILSSRSAARLRSPRTGRIIRACRSRRWDLRPGLSAGSRSLSVYPSN
jgi:predicted RNA binding protein YcfA (HicA-like mRNA interferase family)